MTCKIGFFSLDIIPKELYKNSYYINANKLYKNILNYKHYYDKINDKDILSVIKHNISSNFLPSNYTVHLTKLLHIKEELKNVKIKIEYEKESDCVIKEENPFKISCLKQRVNNSVFLHSFDLNSIYIFNSKSSILNITIKGDIMGSEVPIISTKNKIFNWIYNHQVMTIHTMKNIISDIAREQQLNEKDTLDWIREELQGNDNYNMNTAVLNELCNFLEKNY